MENVSFTGIYNQTSDNALLSILVNDEDYIPYGSRLETYIVPIIFLFIFIVGSIGNILTIVIITRENPFLSPSCIYMLNLAYGDLIVIFFTVPFVGTIYTFESWPYGLIICKLSEFIRDISFSITILTLTLMSYDRFKRTSSLKIHGALKKLKNYKYKIMLIIIWTVSVASGLPAAINSCVKQEKITEHLVIEICTPFPDNLGSSYPKLIVLSKFFLLYLLPLIVIGFCYLNMFIDLKKHANNHQSKKLNTMSGRKQFRHRVLIFFLIAFIICFFPNHVFMIWFYFDPDEDSNYNQFWHIWRIIGFVLTFLNSCMNPLILVLVSHKFRKQVQKYLSNCTLSLF